MLTDRVKNYRHILWDWNGTLLDDAEIAMDSMNRLLERRKLPLLDMERYKGIFTFPVKDYYAKLGFDFEMEPFEKLASEFISEFLSDPQRFRLHRRVKEVLAAIERLGISQSILSASREEDLVSGVRRLGIDGCFTRMAGIRDIYGAGKVSRGFELLEELDLKPGEALLIGDTVHDFEVAEALGCGCLLVSWGHQDYGRISSCNADIIEDFAYIEGYIKSEAIA